MADFCRLPQFFFNINTGVVMKHYEIKYQLNDNSGYSVTTVVASSASQAREKIKAKHPYDKVRIISCVER
jgi:hypothetical protein